MSWKTMFEAGDRLEADGRSAGIGDRSPIEQPVVDGWIPEQDGLLAGDRLVAGEREPSDRDPMRRDVRCIARVAMVHVDGAVASPIGSVALTVRSSSRMSCHPSRAYEK